MEDYPMGDFHQGVPSWGKLLKENLPWRRPPWGLPHEGFSMGEGFSIMGEPAPRHLDIRERRPVWLHLG